MNHTHITAQTQFVESGRIRFAYRRFGRSVGVPLLFMQHFRGGMDHWDPAVVDGLAANRPIILFDNAGVAASSGDTPSTIDAMADHAAEFARALGLSQMDVLGFSIGGYIAQAFTLHHAPLVRRLILVGTAPRAGESTQDAKTSEHAASTDPTTGESGLEAFLYLFFRPSATSQAAGVAFWARRHLRKTHVDPPSSPQTMSAQMTAIAEWRRVRGERYAELARITQPVLVVSGKEDVMVPTSNSFVLVRRIANAQLVIYPDAGHGSLFQFPELFVAHSSLFLDGVA